MVGKVRKLSSSIPKILKNLSVTFEFSLGSDRHSCADLVGDFYLVGLEVLFTAFEKINSGFEFSLRSFRMAYSLGRLPFVWIWMISVSLFNISQFLENALWSASL